MPTTREQQASWEARSTCLPPNLRKVKAAAAAKEWESTSAAPKMIDAQDTLQAAREMAPEVHSSARRPQGSITTSKSLDHRSNSNEAHVHVFKTSESLFEAFVDSKMKLVVQDEQLLGSKMSLEDKDRQLLHGEAKLAEKDKQLLEKETNLVEKDKQLSENETKLEEKDKQLSDSQTKLAAVEMQLVDSKLKLAAMDKQKISAVGLS
ncbi:unnamed protein product [Zymoseptoria tritici ST99CH_3D7]|uniref:Uncharacterized protein n=1 Tax=Zymoseptoria tritici (strain ST99CH_3D7) TaxID=1276538 RepID=A0A1X7RR78_ZYMT9|nr:unnamed protein product [Zymoseptoria tritici ST99CH_3D7]